MMTRSKRRRGAQPGNHNARKHGVYRCQHLATSRKRGAQPGNLNNLVPARYSSLAPPLVSPLPGASLTAQIALFERQLLHLLNESGNDSVDLAARLHQLTLQLVAMLRLQSNKVVSTPIKPERNLP